MHSTSAHVSFLITNDSNHDYDDDDYDTGDDDDGLPPFYKCIKQCTRVLFYLSDENQV